MYMCLDMYIYIYKFKFIHKLNITYNLVLSASPDNFNPSNIPLVGYMVPFNDISLVSPIM